jgi:hypothetical protein
VVPSCRPTLRTMLVALGLGLGTVVSANLANFTPNLMPVP